MGHRIPAVVSLSQVLVLDAAADVRLSKWKVGQPGRYGGQTVAFLGRCGQVSQPLTEAIANAYHWQEQLESGEYAEITGPAKALGVDRTYAGQMLGMTSLAPNIVQAVPADDAPQDLKAWRVLLPL